MIAKIKLRIRVMGMSDFRSRIFLLLYILLVFDHPRPDRGGGGWCTPPEVFRRFEVPYGTKSTFR